MTAPPTGVREPVRSRRPRRPSRGARRRVGQPSAAGRLLGWVVLLVAVAVALFPLYWTVLTSLKRRVDTLAVPPKFAGFSPTLDNYRSVFANADFVRSYLVTMEVTAGSTLLTVTAGSLAAYAMARHRRFAGRRPLELLLVVIRAMPGVVLVVPLYGLAVRFGLYDQPGTLMIVYAALNLPFAVWLMLSFISAVPYELEECARLDGASTLGVLFRVVLPIVLPGLAATTIFVALLAWNEFLIPLALADRAAQTLPVFVGGFISSRSIDWGPMAAAAASAMLPIALLTVLVQRRLVSGLSLGAVKD